MRKSRFWDDIRPGMNVWDRILCILLYLCFVVLVASGIIGLRYAADWVLLGILLVFSACCFLVRPFSGRANDMSWLALIILCLGYLVVALVGAGVLLFHAPLVLLGDVVAGLVVFVLLWRRGMFEVLGF